MKRDLGTSNLPSGMFSADFREKLRNCGLFGRESRDYGSVSHKVVHWSILFSLVVVVVFFFCKEEGKDATYYRSGRSLCYNTINA